MSTSTDTWTESLLIADRLIAADRERRPGAWDRQLADERDRAHVRLILAMGLVHGAGQRHCPPRALLLASVPLPPRTAPMTLFALLSQAPSDYQHQATDLRERINDATGDETEFARIGELATFVNSLALGQVFASAPGEDAAQTTVGDRLDQL